MCWPLFELTINIIVFYEHSTSVFINKWQTLNYMLYFFVCVFVTSNNFTCLFALQYLWQKSMLIPLPWVKRMPKFNKNTVKYNKNGQIFTWWLKISVFIAKKCNSISFSCLKCIIIMCLFNKTQVPYHYVEAFSRFCDQFLWTVEKSELNWTTVVSVNFPGMNFCIKTKRKTCSCILKFQHFQV